MIGGVGVAVVELGGGRALCSWEESIVGAVGSWLELDRGGLCEPGHGLLWGPCSWTVPSLRCCRFHLPCWHPVRVTMSADGALTS